jgi:pimeloyl-ACP methyl ester carboxylesterase
MKGLRSHTHGRPGERPDQVQAGQHGLARWLDLGGPVRYLDYGGSARDPLIVCVHGLGGSAVNWSAIAPLLTGSFRVIAPDLAGHGLTRSAGRGTDVASNRALLHAFLESVSANPVILMGNSMGGMIALLEASAAPEQVSRLVLIDPALPFVPARPGLLAAAALTLGALPWLGRAVLSRMHDLRPETVVAAALTLCCAEPASVPADVVAQHVALARQRADFPGVGRDMSVAARSVIATAASSEYRERTRSVRCPVLVLHGDRDRLVPVSAARAAVRANPSWSLAVMRDVGHVPQLETPRCSAAIVSDWLRADDSRTGRTSRRRLRLRPEDLTARDLRPWPSGTRRTVKMRPPFPVRGKTPQS